MSRLAVLASWLACVLLAACGGGGGGGGNPDSTTDVDLHVDAVNGDDVSGDGTSDNPFKTITRAVQRAGLGGRTIRVAAGTYDDANGELFPITPGIDVVIVGTEMHLPFSTRRLSKIVGGGPWQTGPDPLLNAAVIPNEGNRLEALEIENPMPFVPGGVHPAAVVLARAEVTMVDCTLRDSDKGVRILAGAQDTLIEGCFFTGNDMGIYVDSAGPGNRVQLCLVQGNRFGVFLSTPGADFGGDLAGSTGGNAFTANTQHDFVLSGIGADAYAVNCFWDHAPPTMTSGLPPADPVADVWLVSASSVVEVAGAQVYDPGNDPLPTIDL